MTRPAPGMVIYRRWVSNTGRASLVRILEVQDHIPFATCVVDYFISDGRSMSCSQNFSMSLLMEPVAHEVNPINWLLAVMRGHWTGDILE